MKAVGNMAILAYIKYHTSGRKSVAITVLMSGYGISLFHYLVGEK